MGAEKTGVKTGGLFHLFDWNRKSRKKLFPNGNIAPDVAKEGTNTNNDEQTSRSCLIEDNNTRGLSSVKGNSDYSCASSVTDEEGNGTRAPGVVARLMGLDSLPTVDVSEPYSTPLFDSRSLQENCYRKRGPEFNIDDNFSNVGVRSDCYARKPLELRSQKIPSSPIERFQTEVLPPRSAKSLPITHYKLLSPIKNPSFVSGKNAAHIMEAAAKILEPGLRANAKCKGSSPGPSSLSLEVRESDERITVSQRLSRLPESSRRPVESNAIKYLKGYSMNKSWNALEDSTSVRASPEWGERSSAGAKDKGKTISLAIQAKVNIRRREGSTTFSGIPSVQWEQDEAKLNWSFKSQPNSKNMPQKNVSTPCPSGVLKQNNQKQNCHANKEKLAAKSSMSNQQKKKVPSGDANSGKSRILNKIQASSKTGYRKDLPATDLEKDGSSSTTKNVSRKKRLIDRNYQSEKKSSTSTILVGSHVRHIQSSVMIDEHQKWGGDGGANGANIVSFTFTSPMIKSTVGSQLTHIMERHDISSSSVAMDGERNDADAKNSNVPSLDLNMITGDALSVLLEQKLRVLTLGLESSSKIGKTGNGSASALYPHLISDSGNTHIVPIECQKETTCGPCKTSVCDVSDNSLSVNGMLFNLCTGLQEGERLSECSSSGDVHKECEQQYASPLSILEASFSSDSCSSSDSSDSNNGNKICSSVEAQTFARFSKNETPGEAEMDLSDSASSICAEITNEEPALGISTCHKISEEEMEYVRDILQNVGIDFKDMASDSLNHSLDPLLFDLLENKKYSSRNRTEDKNHRLWRKVLFDCVDECLGSKHSRYFEAGCQTRARGSYMIGRVDKFADEIYKEISGWKRMGDWMVDEVVDKDMSSHLGRWVDFEAEAFEAGVEIEKALVNCLIDEVVADFIM